MSAKTCKYIFALFTLIGCNELFAWSGPSDAAPLGNSVPVAYAQKIGVSLNSPPKDITLKATDVDGNPLSFIIVSGPSARYPESGKRKLMAIHPSCELPGSGLISIQS